jgi:folylpolyglutamate synthase/dihydropteroate synthase
LQSACHFDAALFTIRHVDSIQSPSDDKASMRFDVHAQYGEVAAQADAWKDLEPSSSTTATSSAREAFTCVRQLAAEQPKSEIRVFVTGSLYLVGSVLTLIDECQPIAM